MVAGPELRLLSEVGQNRSLQPVNFMCVSGTGRNGYISLWSVAEFPYAQISFGFPHQVGQLCP